MTTPDHRPYWFTTGASLLAARLDRERRQACRRAALAEWREFSYDLRRNRGHDAWVCKWCIGHITLALAFRAAARTP